MACVCLPRVESALCHSLQLHGDGLCSVSHLDLDLLLQEVSRHNTTVMISHKYFLLIYCYQIRFTMPFTCCHANLKQTRPYTSHALCKVFSGLHFNVNIVHRIEGGEPRCERKLNTPSWTTWTIRREWNSGPNTVSLKPNVCIDVWSDLWL